MALPFVHLTAFGVLFDVKDRRLGAFVMLLIAFVARIVSMFLQMELI